jgi:hypothetical protein
MKVGKGRLIIKMGKLIIEVAVSIVPHFNHSVFRPEGVAEIFSNLMVMYLDDPIVQVCPVEERDPFMFLLMFRRARNKNGYYYQGAQSSDHRMFLKVRQYRSEPVPVFDIIKKNSKLKFTSIATRAPPCS